MSVALQQLMPLLPVAAIALLGGLGLGVVYFRTLRLCADLFVRGERSALAVGLTLGRFTLLGGALFLASRFGAPGLIGLALGMLIGRQWVMRSVAGEST